MTVSKAHHPDVMSRVGEPEHPYGVASGEYITAEERIGGCIHAPGIREKVPGGHNWHADEEALLYVPIPHGIHASELMAPKDVE